MDSLRRKDTFSMPEKRIPWTIVFPDWELELLKDWAKRDHVSLNRMAIMAINEYLVSRIEQDAIGVAIDKQENMGPNQRLVLSYVKRLEERKNRKPPSAADLHNWLKDIPVEIIEDTLQILTDKHKVERIVTPHTKRYRSVK